MMWFMHINVTKYNRIFEKCTVCSTTLCSFWEILSGHFVRFDCNHSDSYAFRRIPQTDSLSHEEIYLAQNSAFLRNIQAGSHHVRFQQ